MIDMIEKEEWVKIYEEINSLNLTILEYENSFSVSSTLKKDLEITQYYLRDLRKIKQIIRKKEKQLMEKASRIRLWLTKKG